MTRFLLLWSLLTLSTPALAQTVVTVEPTLAGKPFSSDKTRTFLWESKKPAATLIFLPGGDGRIGLTDSTTSLSGPFEVGLRPLSDHRSASGRLNVVVVDSPSTLHEGTQYPTSRAQSEHLMRIESVVLYYKERLGRPIWIMGHSNGAVSATEFYKYLQKNKKESLVAGIVYSAARHFADFSSATTNLPVLFLHHEKDGCFATTLAASKEVFARLKKVDAAKVEFVTIKGGTTAPGHPCTSGYHMYHGAGYEVYTAIDAFMAEYYR